MSAVNGSIATANDWSWGGIFKSIILDVVKSVSPAVPYWLGIKERPNDNVPAGVMYPYPAQPPASASEDYGKYIVWGVLGLVFFAVLFMGFSFVMRISDNRKR